MKRTDSIPLIAVAAFGLLAFTHVKNVAKQNQYYAGIRMQLGKPRFEGNIVHIPFHFHNPNTKGVTVRSIVGDFFINGVKVGNVQSYEVKTLAGNAETLYTVSMKIKIVAAVKYLVDLYQMKKPVLNTTFKGTININNKPIPVTVNYKVL